MPRKKVENHPELERDTASNAVINTNKDAFAARREQIAMRAKREEEFRTLQAEVEELKKIVKKLSK